MRFRRWRPGGRVRQKAAAKRWTDNRRQSIGGDDFEALQEKLVEIVPRRRRKEG